MEEENLENESKEKENNEKIKGFTLSKKTTMIIVCLSPIILFFILLMSPFLTMCFLSHSYYNYKLDTLVKKQKHTRALKNNILNS